jgi:formylglycine-generating enzyme required for sulfatase activity
MRSGFWDMKASFLRSASRFAYHPSRPKNGIGFRVAQDL